MILASDTHPSLFTRTFAGTTCFIVRAAQNVQESVEWLWHDSQLIRLVEAFNVAMFPEDWTAPEPPTAEERVRAHNLARAALLQTLPDVLVTLVGTTNARRGIGKLFDALQSKAMNKRLFFTLLEAILSTLFPELARRDLQLVTVTVDAREAWAVPPAAKDTDVAGGAPPLVAPISTQ